MYEEQSVDAMVLFGKISVRFVQLEIFPTLINNDTYTNKMAFSFHSSFRNHGSFKVAGGERTKSRPDERHFSNLVHSAGGTQCFVDMFSGTNALFF